MLSVRGTPVRQCIRNLGYPHFDMGITEGDIEQFSECIVATAEEAFRERLTLEEIRGVHKFMNIFTAEFAQGLANAKEAAQRKEEDFPIQVR